MTMLSRKYAANERLDIGVASPATLWLNNFTTNYTVKTTSAIYIIYVDEFTNDTLYIKSVDGGRSYATPVTVRTGTVINVSVWYDRWSGIASDLIHVAQVDSNTDDVYYRTINTANNDALSTETTIVLGSTTGASAHLSITRTRGGNVLCKAGIDGDTEGGFFKLLNANVPNGAWEAALTINEALAANDKMILMPGFALDNNDAIGIFWDASAAEISMQLYDDSANTWSETSIATSMTDLALSTASSNFSAAVDLTNSRVVLVAWTATDTANADLRCWTVTEGAITEVTNVVLNSTDDQGLCAISIDTANDDWYVVYGGKSDGSETFKTALRPYYKVSTDNGTTWSAESLLAPDAIVREMQYIQSCNNFTGHMPFVRSTTRGGNYMLSVIIERNP